MTNCQRQNSASKNDDHRDPLVGVMNGPGKIPGNESDPLLNLGVMPCPLHHPDKRVSVIARNHNHMPRPKKYETSAERQQAYRDRQRNALRNSKRSATGLTIAQLAYFDREFNRHDRVLQEYAKALATKMTDRERAALRDHMEQRRNALQ